MRIFFFFVTVEVAWYFYRCFAFLSKNDVDKMYNRNKYAKLSETTDKSKLFYFHHFFSLVFKVTM